MFQWYYRNIDIWIITCTVNRDINNVFNGADDFESFLKLYKKSFIENNSFHENTKQFCIKNTMLHCNLPIRDMC